MRLRRPTPIPPKISGALGVVLGQFVALSGCDRESQGERLLGPAQLGGCFCLQRDLKPVAGDRDHSRDTAAPSRTSRRVTTAPSTPSSNSTPTRPTNSAAVCCDESSPRTPTSPSNPQGIRDPYPHPADDPADPIHPTPLSSSCCSAVGDSPGPGRNLPHLSPAPACFVVSTLT